MKNILLILAFSFSFAVTATAAKKQQPERGGGQNGPACPSYDCNDEPDRGPDGKHDGTYEEGEPSDDGYFGDERDGGNDDGGGMIGELFFVPVKKTYPVAANVTKEDRGATIVYTTTTQEDISADETCTTIVTTVVDKKTGKVLSTDTKEFCNTWPL